MTAGHRAMGTYFSRPGQRRALDGPATPRPPVAGGGLDTEAEYDQRLPAGAAEGEHK